jgi:glucose dehydrogenase
MVTRPAPEPPSLVAGLSVLCGLVLGTGWLVLRGGSFAIAIAAMAVLTTILVGLLVHRPRQTR